MSVGNTGSQPRVYGDSGRDSCSRCLVLVRPQMPVDIECRLRACVPQTGLDGLDVEAVRDEQTCEVVAQIVVAEVPPGGRCRCQVPGLMEASNSR